MTSYGSCQNISRVPCVTHHPSYGKVGTRDMLSTIFENICECPYPMRNKVSWVEAFEVLWMMSV